MIELKLKQYHEKPVVFPAGFNTCKELNKRNTLGLHKRNSNINVSCTSDESDKGGFGVLTQKFIENN